MTEYQIRAINNKYDIRLIYGYTYGDAMKRSNLNMEEWILIDSWYID